MLPYALKYWSCIIKSDYFIIGVPKEPKTRHPDHGDVQQLPVIWFIWNSNPIIDHVRLHYISNCYMLSANLTDMSYDDICLTPFWTKDDGVPFHDYCIWSLLLLDIVLICMDQITFKIILKSTHIWLKYLYNTSFCQSDQSPQSVLPTTTKWGIHNPSMPVCRTWRQTQLTIFWYSYHFRACLCTVLKIVPKTSPNTTFERLIKTYMLTPNYFYRCLWMHVWMSCGSKDLLIGYDLAHLCVQMYEKWPFWPKNGLLCIADLWVHVRLSWFIHPTTAHLILR